MHCGNYSRRDFLRKGAMTVGAMALASRMDLLPALANSDGSPYKAMVFIFLNGGNDAWNTVVPLETTNYNNYAAARPVLAYKKTDLLPIQPRSDSRPYGLNPNMPKLKGLWDAGKMASIVNVGSLVAPITPTDFRNGISIPPGLYGHDSMAQAIQNLNSSVSLGWGQGMNQYLPANSNSSVPTFMNVGPGASVYLAGPQPYISLVPGQVRVLEGNSGSPADNARNQALRNMLGLSSASALVNVLGLRTTDALNQSQMLSNILGTTTINTAFPIGTSNNAGPQLLQIAKLIKNRIILGQEKRQIFFVNLPGYDVHGGQLASHANLLSDLDNGMKSFYDATVELGISDQVTTFAMGEFGRTVQCSGDGSDHAWGGVSFVVGGAVNGGDFYGQYPSLALGGVDDVDIPGSGVRGRIVPTTSVEQFGATLAKWFGVAPSSIPSVFPLIGRFGIQDMGFMKAG